MPAFGATPARGTIKYPIQRGVILLSATIDLIKTVTITSVDTTKTELRLLGYLTTSSATLTDNLATLVLTNATTITVSRFSATSSSLSVSWELTEFY